MTSHLLADWLELSAFASSSGRVYVEEINEALEIEEDIEPDEIHAEDDQKEARVQAAISAIEERSRVLRDAYPFDLLDRGRILRLQSDSANAGQSAYLLCLLLSHTAKDGILADSPLPDIAPARDLFQVCATLCAAGFCGGPAFSFGWPRPDKTHFHTKLVQVYSVFKDGTPKPTVPPGSPPKIKDGGIDVIAWSHQPDGKPGGIYLLGQAASGQDWKEKSVRQFLNVFHKWWFQDQPASECTPSLFIPFCLSHDGEGTDHLEQQEIERNYLRYLIELLGQIFYRYRIPDYANRAVSLAESGIGPIERLESVQDISTWLVKARSYLITEAS